MLIPELVLRQLAIWHFPHLAVTVLVAIVKPTVIIIIGWNICLKDLISTIPTFLIFEMALAEILSV
jgi:hypothetical protein